MIWAVLDSTTRWPCFTRLTRRPIIAKSARATSLLEKTPVRPKSASHSIRFSPANPLPKSWERTRQQSQRLTCSLVRRNPLVLGQPGVRCSVLTRPVESGIHSTAAIAAVISLSAMCIVLTGPIGPSIWAAALLPPVVAVWWQSSTRLGRVESGVRKRGPKNRHAGGGSRCGDCNR